MSDQVKDILLELGYKLDSYGKEWRTKPLYRNSENRTSLRIFKDSGRFNDFSAGITGDLAELVRLSLGLSDVSEAKKYLSGRVTNKKVEEDEPNLKVNMNKVYPEEMLVRLFPHYDYWTERGISEEVLQKFKGGLSFSGKMYQRFVFPVYDERNKIIGFAGRAVSEDREPKWKLIGPKFNFLYPIHLNSNLIKDEVMLVEGIGDVLTLNECGYENSMSLFGTGISCKLLIYLVSKQPKNIYISTNNEPNNESIGNEAAVKIKDKLRKYFSVNRLHIHLPTRKDVNDILKQDGKAGVNEWLKKR